MTYKILLVKNRYTKKVDVQKNIDWFKNEAKLDLIFDVVTSDFEVTTQDVSNATFKGVICGADINDKLRTIVPENKYNAVAFIYGNTLKGITVSCTNIPGPLYPNTEVIQLHTNKWQILNHELFHAFFGKANRIGANIIDNIDNYFRDNILDTDNGETNRTIALKTLAPYWDKICSLSQFIDEGCKPGNKFSTTTGFKCPNIPVIPTTPVKTPTLPKVDSSMPSAVLTRGKDQTRQTMGVLKAQNGGATFICDTLELSWLNNAQQISCIPTGTYIVKWIYSWGRMKWIYQLDKVPGRTYIQIHSGNYASGKHPDILGCILLGKGFKDINGDNSLDIINSTDTIKLFNTFMQNKTFVLTIK